MTAIQISTMISIGSLALGLGAWAFGIWAIIRAQSGFSYTKAVCSFSLCTISLLLQLFEIQNRVKIGDYAAIGDTIGAVLFAAVTLVFITVVLNIVALVTSRKK